MDKITAWHTAVELVKPVVSVTGLAQYTTQHSDPLTYSVADQFIEQIIRVADWLREE